MVIRESGANRPGVVVWWFVFCFVAGACFLLAFLSALTGFGDVQSQGEAAEEFGAFFASVVMYLFTTLLFAIGPFLPRGKAAWVFGIVQFVMSLLCSSCICLPIAVPLLVFWLRADCREWFEGTIDESTLVDVFE